MSRLKPRLALGREQLLGLALADVPRGRRGGGSATRRRRPPRPAVTARLASSFIDLRPTSRRRRRRRLRPGMRARRAVRFDHRTVGHSCSQCSCNLPRTPPRPQPRARKSRGPNAAIRERRHHTAQPTRSRLPTGPARLPARTEFDDRRGARHRRDGRPTGAVTEPSCTRANRARSRVGSTTDSAESLEMLEDLDLRSDETNDPNLTAEEGLPLCRRSIRPSSRRGDPEGSRIAARIRASALDTPYEVVQPKASRRGRDDRPRPRGTTPTPSRADTPKRSRSKPTGGPSARCGTVEDRG